MLEPTSIVSAIPTSTPFVGPETLERQFGQAFELRLGANESLFGPSPKAIEAMKLQAANSQFYGDPEGHHLRSEIAHQNHCSIDNVLLGSGIDDLLMLFSRTCLGPGDLAVTTLGSYPTFEYAVRSVGGQLAHVPYLKNKVDLQALLRRARQSKAKILYLANPDNPSGSWHDPCTIQGLIDELPADVLLLLDEAYMDFVPELGTFETELPNVVRFRTFSKAHGMAGLRIGYALCHQDHIATANKIRLHFGVNSVAQAGALASLQDPEHVKSVVAETSRVKDRLTDQLQIKGVSTLPSQTNFILIDLGNREGADACLVDLRDKRVFVRKPAIPPLDNYIRVTIGPPAEMELFLERFLNVIQSPTYRDSLSSDLAASIANRSVIPLM